MDRPRMYVALSPSFVQELHLEHAFSRLEGLVDIEWWSGPGNPSAEATADGATRAHLLVTGWGTPTLKPVLEAWQPGNSPLTFIAHTAGSVRRLVPVEALERGLRMTHASDAIADAVADFTLGAMITSRRRMFAAAQRMKAGQDPPPIQQTHELRGSVVGVVGASNVGRKVMHLLRAWDVEVLLYDPYCPDTLARALGVTKVDLDELVRRSDIVTLHAPVTDETAGMFDAARFAAMRDGALFVNTARGRLIDHDALLAELRTGRLSAFLDVYDPHEPQDLDPDFFRLDNCTVLPHIAGASEQARRRQGEHITDEILRFLRDEPLRFEITAQRFAAMA